jgi:hypothetical protein
MNIDPYLITQLLKQSSNHCLSLALSEGGLLGQLKRAIINHFYSQPPDAVCIVTIGKYEYNATKAPIFRLPEYQNLIELWQIFHYCPDSNKRDQAEWSIIQAYFYVLDKQILPFRGTRWEGVRYACLPLTMEDAEKVLDYAEIASQILGSFVPPDSHKEESERAYWARVADALEHHIYLGMPPASKTIKQKIATMAANFFLVGSIENPPSSCTWEEISGLDDEDDDFDNHVWVLADSMHCDCHTEHN